MPDGAGEALEERRARERGRLRELGDRPRARDIAVHLPDRRRQPRVGQSAQQPRGRVVARRRPQRLDEQHLHEAREHEVAARPLLGRLLADEPHQRRQPLGAAHVDDRRQQRRQQRRVRRVEGEVAAQQLHVGVSIGSAVADVVRRGGRHVGSMSSGVTGSKPDSVKPGVAGRSTKSPASSVIGGVAVDREAAAALQHGAEARLAVGRVADAPAAGAADALREHRARPEQRDDFREWIDSSLDDGE